MIEKRYYKIQDVVLKLSDTRNIVRNICSIYEELQNEYNSDISAGIISESTSPPDISFEVTTEDQIEYSICDVDFFNEDSIIASKVISRVLLDCSYFHKHLFITIDISDSRIREYSTSDLTVKGRDTQWVHAIFQQLRECIDSLPKQNKIIRKCRWPIALVITGIISFTFTFIISSFLKIKSPVDVGAFDRMLTFIFMLLMGILTPIIASKIDKLWPKVEFIPSAEHNRRTQKQKSNIRWVIVAILIPFIISLVIKYF
jgi:hypothetical protein